MPKISPIELETLIEEKEYWASLEDFIPEWKLRGWTYKTSASFSTVRPGFTSKDTIEITGEQRDQIIKAILDFVGKN